jgi:hypothetical protein
MSEPYTQIETIREFLRKRNIPTGISRDGHVIHAWNEKKTLCDKNLVQRTDRLFSWGVSRFCKKCHLAVEEMMKGGEV